MIRYAVDDLRARLERERRQACRRGAAAQRWLGLAQRDDERAHIKAGHDDDAAIARSVRTFRLQLALAFRAAARAK